VLLLFREMGEPFTWATEEATNAVAPGPVSVSTKECAEEMDPTWRSATHRHLFISTHSIE
jgi:hypothetical protein